MTAKALGGGGVIRQPVSTGFVILSHVTLEHAC